MGDAAWRCDRPADTDAATLLAALRAWPHVVDVVVSEAHVLVAFDPARPPADPSGIIEGCRGRAAAAAVRTHRVRVRYDGPDLAEAAAVAGLSVDELCARHAGRSYRVRVVGFLPGFAYLGDVDERLVLPRRASPRARVPAGAVGLAGPYTGVYPLASSGGWNLIGTAVDFVAFSPAAGATLQLGDEVRFEAA
jgi:5-oxoprolinase (ATP-hydrolysing) subunit A